MPCGCASSPTALVAAITLIGLQPLDHSITNKHSAIDREVSANHKGTHGCILLGQMIRFVRIIRLVFAAIDEYQASEAARATLANLVRRVDPATTMAKT